MTTSNNIPDLLTAIVQLASAVKVMAEKLPADDPDRARLLANSASASGAVGRILVREENKPKGGKR